MTNALPVTEKAPTPDTRTATHTRSGNVRVPTIDGHLSPRAIRSLVAALLKHMRVHRLNKRQTRETLAKIDELRAELLAIRKLRQALKTGKPESDAELVVQPVIAAEEPRQLTKAELKRLQNDDMFPV